MSFTAKDVMALRQKTGLGMMDCKKALTECDGDLAAAEEWLRAKKKGKMDTRTERVTGEGRRRGHAEPQVQFGHRRDASTDDYSRTRSGKRAGKWRAPR